MDNRCVAYFSVHCILVLDSELQRSDSNSIYVTEIQELLKQTVGFRLHVYELLQQPPNQCPTG